MAEPAAPLATALQAADWPALNLALRAALALLLGLAAALLWRDARQHQAGRLGALFALGVAAYTLEGLPALQQRGLWWALPVHALATGNAVVLWWLARCLFDDAFRLRPAPALLWLPMAALGIAACLAPLAWAPLLGRLVLLATLGLGALALGQALATWRDDLVDSRRRLRAALVSVAFGYIALNTAVRLGLPPAGPGAPAPAAAATLDAALLLVLSVGLLWPLLRARAPAEDLPLADAGGPGHTTAAVAPGRGLAAGAVPGQAPSAGPPAATASATVTTAAAITAATAAGPSPAAAAAPVTDLADERALRELLRLVDEREAFRQEGLTIAGLAMQLALPEYRLRRLIHQRLGHRHFNAFVNSRRLAAVKRALADPARAEVAVLTLALEAGFQSIGPFNRAFKADTGLTPTDYRRAALAGQAPAGDGPRSQAD